MKNNIFKKTAYFFPLVQLCMYGIFAFEKTRRWTFDTHARSLNSSDERSHESESLIQNVVNNMLDYSSCSYWLPQCGTIYLKNW